MKKFRIILCMTLVACTCYSAEQEKIRMHVMITPSHEHFFKKWFSPSLKDDYELVVTRHKQESSGIFMKPGWTKAVLRKVDMIVDAIKRNWGKIFIYSDVDIQFFRPTWPIIASLIGNNDMLIQRVCMDSKRGSCTGFFACKGNERALKTWEAIRAHMIRVHAGKKEADDQRGFNAVMKKNPFQLKVADLPPSFFSGGMYNCQLWQPGKKLRIPKDIVLHHANWTLSVGNKLKQFAYVRAQVKKMNAKKQEPNDDFAATS